MNECRGHVVKCVSKDRERIYRLRTLWEGRKMQSRSRNKCNAGFGLINQTVGRTCMYKYV